MIYICESCESKQKVAYDISKCEECGKEICMSCSNSLRICDECSGVSDHYTYPDGFYKFGQSEGAKPLNDDEIRKYLEQVRESLADSNKEYGDFSLIATGDSVIIGLKYYDEYQFIVAKNYEDLSIDKEEINKFKFK